mgnify:FL=1
MKLLGLLLVSLCPVYIGISFSLNAKKELLELEGFIALIRHIRYRISFSLAKQGEIFSSFSIPALERNGFFPLLRSLPAGGGDSMLTRALQAGNSFLSIDKETGKTLLSFGESLGKVSLDKQIADCDACLSRLEDIAAEKRKALPAKQKLCRSLGILIGGCALLILI